MGDARGDRPLSWPVDDGLHGSPLGGPVGQWMVFLPSVAFAPIQSVYLALGGDQHGTLAGSRNYPGAVMTVGDAIHECLEVALLWGGRWGRQLVCLMGMGMGLGIGIGMGLAWWMR